MPGYDDNGGKQNHAHSDARMDETFAAIAKTASARLLVAYGILLKSSDGQSVQLPIVIGEGGNEHNLIAMQGQERGLIFKYIAETLGNRLDR